MGYLVGRAGRKRLLAGDAELVLGDVGVVEPGDGLLAAQAIAVGVREGLADRVFDEDIVGHQREPALLVVGVDATPRALRRG